MRRRLALVELPQQARQRSKPIDHAVEAAVRRVVARHENGASADSLRVPQHRRVIIHDDHDLYDRRMTGADWGDDWYDDSKPEPYGWRSGYRTTRRGF